MSKREERIQQSLVRMLDIPRDLAFDLPKIVMLGNMEMSIENHDGLMEFTPERIVVSARKGAIEITGRDLCMRNILVYEMVIEGRIDSVRFLD